ncbi:Morphology and auto-aggregation control protein [Legionella massiliensis]|uniref:Morphology and auto-aggregation control protein n=1 Tax=Legionella massiliensis TaxID=1034943 RepID=A0A078KZQ3_9GAMM|nr:LysR family transcriptional regulator [Legionella massiliensis]CDZ78457.1 Morphology and auto-aggregation control protein [Legionella massiliensis]CEE14195.1 Hydrogen peroxide-inducible genes activator [Legionella massiliensis]
MNILDLKTFLKVIEYRSTLLASKHMHASQPTISRRIKKIEQEVGAQLLFSNHLGLELTEKGKAFLPYFRQLVNIYNEMMKAEHNDRKSQPKLNINVGVNPYVSFSVLPEFINHMHEHHPEYFIVSKIAPGKDRRINLENGNFDLVILPKAGDSSVDSISTTALWQEKILPVVSVNHPLAKQDSPISLAELVKYDAILLGGQSLLRQNFDALVAQKGLSLKIAAEVNTIYNNIKMIEFGKSWGLINERLLNEQLRIVQLSDFSMDLEFHAYYQKKRSEERLIWMFVEHLKKWLHNSPDFRKYLIKTKSLSIQNDS